MDNEQLKQLLNNSDPINEELGLLLLKNQHLDVIARFYCELEYLKDHGCRIETRNLASELLQKLGDLK